jgi:hypothetical protein
MPYGRALVPILFVVAAAASCGRSADEAPPVATPTIALARNEVAIGSPLDIVYRFAVAPDAPPFSEDYWVFVHFLDDEGELMWTDDHQPPTPTRQWRRGQAIEYTRTMFVPKFPHDGQARIDIGLFSRATNARLPLAGRTEGQRAYTVARFTLTPHPDNLFVVFKDGWHATEVAEESSGIEWQWSKREAGFTFRNPKRDVWLYLQVDQPAAALPGPQRVDLRIGGHSVDSFLLNAGQVELRRIAIPAASLGDGETVEVRLNVDKTFVPAAVPQLKSSDTRELGVRVFRAYVEPS